MPLTNINGKQKNFFHDMKIALVVARIVWKIMGWQYSSVCAVLLTSVNAEPKIGLYFMTDAHVAVCGLRSEGL